MLYSLDMLHSFFSKESPEKILQALNSLSPEIMTLGNRNFCIKEKDSSLRNVFPKTISLKEIILSIKANKNPMTQAVIEQILELDKASDRLYYREPWYQRFFSNIIDALQTPLFNKKSELETLINEVRHKESEREMSLLTAIAYTEATAREENEGELWRDLFENNSYQVDSLKQILQLSSLSTRPQLLAQIITLPKITEEQRSSIYKALGQIPSLYQPVIEIVFKSNPQLAPFGWQNQNHANPSPYRDTWRSPF